MSWSWFGDTLLACLLFMLKVTAIIIPLVIGVELLKHFRLIEKFNKPLQPFMKLLGLPAEAAYPLVAGLLLGIIYGSGMIIESARQGLFTRKHLFLISLFLVLCHSLIEDHALVTAVGAQTLILILLRFVLAVVVVAIVNRLIKDQDVPLPSLVAVDADRQDE